MIKVVDSGKKGAIEQMQIDEAYLGSHQEPVLRFYEWSHFSATFGYFIKPEEWIYTEKLEVARRPTGGGLIFHQHDFSFTLLLDAKHPFSALSALERYQRINASVLQAIHTLVPGHFLSLQKEKKVGGNASLCMANPSPYDLMLGAKKVGGASQRKNKMAFIHQCSLFLVPPDWDKIKGRLLDKALLPTLQQVSASIFAENCSQVEEFRQELKRQMATSFTQLLGEG